MYIPRRTPGAGLTFNMTPMIDVVFLLIIFFLVSSHLAKQEAQMELPLPVADSSVEPAATEAPRVTVNVLRKGDLLLAGRRVLPQELTSRLRDRLTDTGGALEVRIRGDRRVVYGDVEPVMLACAEAGVWDVTFAVYRSEDAP